MTNSIELLFIPIKENDKNTEYKVIATIQTQENKLVIMGSLPSAKSVIDAYTKWQQSYEGLLKANHPDSLSIELMPIATNVSRSQLNAQTRELRNQINYWLSSRGFQKIRDKMFDNFNKNDEIFLTIRTDNLYLSKLNFELWEFFTDRENTVLILSNIENMI